MNLMRKILLVSLWYSFAHTCLCADSPTGAMPVVLTVSSHKGKVLSSPQMHLLNTLFSTEAGALGLLRMKMAHTSANRVLTTLPSIDSDPHAVAGQISIVLKPVKEFFAIIQQYSGMIRTLVEESLVGEIEGTGQCKVPTFIDTTAVNQNQRKCFDFAGNKPLILRFMEAHDGVDAFFEKNVSDKEQLYGACQEFCTFFGDLEASLTPDAIKAYKTLVAKMRSTKK